MLWRIHQQCDSSITSLTRLFHISFEVILTTKHLYLSTISSGGLFRWRCSSADFQLFEISIDWYFESFSSSGSVLGRYTRQIVLENSWSFAETISQ